MGVKVENNAVAALVSGITDSATTITVDSAGGFFPDVSASGDYFYGTLCNDPGAPSQLPEIVQVTDITPNGLDYDLTVVRLGVVGGSPSVSWSASSDLELRVTKQLLEDLVTGGVAAVPGYLGHSVQLTTTGAVTASDTGKLVLCNSALGSMTVTLPAIPASNDLDLRYVVVKTTADANTVVLACDAADNIDGNATYSLTKEDELVIVHATAGENVWRIVDSGDVYVEAAEDGSVYGRQNGAWAAVTEEAPIDGTQYARKDAGWEAVSAGGGGTTIPAGSLMMTAVSSAPSGWLLANGAPVSRTTYADLFSAIGTTYGIGDGSTTFNVPDLRGRVPVGDDTMSRSAANRVTSNNSRGDSAGFETHTLTEAEMPRHDHSCGNDGGHSHSYSDNTANKSGTGQSGSGISGVSTSTQSGTTGSVGDHNHNIGNTGGDNPHNNLQPYQVVNYIIKT